MKIQNNMIFLKKPSNDTTSDDNNTSWEHDTSRQEQDHSFNYEKNIFIEKEEDNGPDIEL